MKCPVCGQWNRESFPRCFKCGAPLIRQQANGSTPENEQAEAEKRKRQQKENPQKVGKVYIRYDDYGQASALEDDKERVAHDMRDLSKRMVRGRERKNGFERPEQVPLGRSFRSRSGRTVYTQPIDDRPVRPDAVNVPSHQPIGHDDYIPVGNLTTRTIRFTRNGTGHRFSRVVIWLLVLGFFGCVGYFFVYKPLVLDKRETPLQDRVTVYNSILNDEAATTVLIPGEEGASIYIKEMRKTYTVAGGYARVDVPDYIWYENDGRVVEETVDATLTPYLKTSAGEQKAMGTISYTVEIPPSTLSLITPVSGYAEVSTELYTLQFRVAANSTVYINDEELTDLVNTQDGLITYNATVPANGENIFVIRTREQHKRENSVTVTLYRAPQQITLNLAKDIASRWVPGYVDDTRYTPDIKGNYPQIEERMTVKCTTLTWANVQIKSPYVNLDLSKLRTDGTFSFEAVFDTIGTNTIVIEASAEGYETTVVRHEVYYCPVANIYTRKAWDMDDNYIDFLNNCEKRIANTQIYVCKGIIREIKATSPQLAVVQLDSKSDRSVLVENRSTDTWEVGGEYRLYADAFGLYNNMPRLIARYTYPYQLTKLKK